MDVFETISRLSLADALLVAAMTTDDIEYCYSFDDDFDGIDGVTRLATASNPYESD
jgi:predicted nucleic acid-binding protein